MSEAGPLEGLLEALRGLDRDLTSQAAGWALVGGVAIALRVLPRTTRDVDVMVAVAGDEQAQKLLGFLLSRGWRFERELTDEHGHIASARLRGPGPRDLVVDLLLRVTGIEAEVTAAADWMEIDEGVEMPVASLASLIALKVLSGRSKDHQDIGALLAAADASDLEKARTLIALIGQRGFDRGKDLNGELDRYLAVGDDSF